jgi:hypothetical protein
MPKRLSIPAHLVIDELEIRYRRAQDPVVRSHWQVIWLLAQGLPSAPVAAVTRYTVNWIRLIARRYNQQGPVGLEDRRHRNPGAAGLLSVAPRSPRLSNSPHPMGAGGRGPKPRPG